MILKELPCGCKMLAEADRKTKSTIEHCKEHKRQWNKHIKHKRSREV